jgi:hypothetical protein
MADEYDSTRRSIGPIKERVNHHNIVSSTVPYDAPLDFNNLQVAAPQIAPLKNCDTLATQNPLTRSVSNDILYSSNPAARIAAQLNARSP